ncbi:MAG: redoxin domain-containing protein [Planctomycetota bacterium]
MHTKLFTTATLALAGCLFAQEPVPAPKPTQDATAKPKALALGDALPKGLAYRSIDGKLQSLDELRGKVVVFHFWSTTCPYEVQAEPKLNALSADFAKKDVVVFGIAANAGEIGAEPDEKAFEEKDEAKLPYAELRQKAKESKMNHALLVDHKAELGRLLDGKTTPHCFVFDKEGKLQYQGALDDDGGGKKDVPMSYVRDAVAAVLAGEKPATQSTKPYG